MWTGLHTFPALAWEWREDGGKAGVGCNAPPGPQQYAQHEKSQEGVKLVQSVNQGAQLDSG